jgi:eukaryotic-like serine/threonine-protein kinase
LSKTKRPAHESASRWIWPFELLERIGEGGMGVVYRARYVVNDREVAVKMLPDDVTSPTVLARFERELEVLKTLKHPNIVLSFGGACEDKQKFYAMELVEGGSLEDQLRKRGRLPWETVIEYGKQMCAALDYLHKNGVVHRDVKPANFLIGDQGQLKLSDFGLASVMAARKITSAGKTAGTLLYMAPEQIRGADIDARTDLYALGCVLYELLTGQPPFIGSTPAATMHMHCKAPIPRAAEVALDCPVALDQLITRLLSKDPDDRPGNAVEVARELAKVTPTVTVVTRERDIDRVLSQKSTPLKIQPPSLATSEEGMSFWPFATALLIIAGLFAWNVGLREASQQVALAEQLWLQAAQEDDAEVKATALVALGKLGFNSQEAIAALTTSTASADEYIRLKAVEGLGALGEKARSQSTLLLKLKKSDPSEKVRQQAAASLRQLEEAESAGFGGIISILLVFSLLMAAGVWFWRTAQPLVAVESDTL